MISTKQFTIFFLLVVVFLVAIMIATSLAWRCCATNTFGCSAGVPVSRSMLAREDPIFAEAFWAF